MRLPAICMVLAGGLPSIQAQVRSLHVLVLDSATAGPVPAVHVVDARGSLLAVTDDSGSGVLDLGYTLSWPLTFTHVAYVSRVLQLPDSVPDLLVVRLGKAVHWLPGAEVRRAAPEVMVRLDCLHVAAFRPGKEGVWVLAYERPRVFRNEQRAGEQLLRGATLLLLDSLFHEIDRIPLSGDAVDLHAGREGSVFLEMADLAHGCERDERGISLTSMDLEDLRHSKLPWTDSVPGWLLGTNATGMYPAFDHLAYAPHLDDARVLCSVVDRPLLALFRSQYKYMSGPDKVVAMDLARELGTDAETVAGYMTAFHRDPYFKAPYAPLFVVDDTLCVFDHCAGLLRRFDTGLQPVDEQPLVHQRERTWKGRLLQDPASGAVYALHARGPRTWLVALDGRTALPGEATVLQLPWPEQVQVWDGHVYYVHRTPHTEEVRTLFREVLR